MRNSEKVRPIRNPYFFRRNNIDFNGDTVSCDGEGEGNRRGAVASKETEI